ncbi:aminoacyl-tRNA hydrolase [bacterium]|nr:aminoacyl-tRNA hydrolase [bacterium]
MKFLIAGLGNIGPQYTRTRHNVGFMVLDHLAKEHQQVFADERYGAVSRFRLKNKQVVLLKPNTFMNLSGKAVKYWLQQEQIPVEQLLVITDDLALNEGIIRLKGKGSDGGHNGLKNIQELLQTTQYARLRFGIGNEFSKGRQIDYVLGEWNEKELVDLQICIDFAARATASFVLEGLANAMNQFNNKDPREI